MSASLDLARRAVACKGWRWLPGMRSLDGDIYICDAFDGQRFANSYPDAHIIVDRGRCALPDLEDPATLGCLLSLVREAWGDPGICVRCIWPEGGQWVAFGAGRPPLIDALSDSAGSEAEALVAALEAAP